MNPVVAAHFVTGLLVISLAVPLIRRKVRMNCWYGVRIPQAFASESAWYEINHFGGRLFLAWGLMIAATAVVGAFIERKDWILYNRVALAIMLVGLALIIARILWFARKRKAAADSQPPRRDS